MWRSGKLRILANVGSRRSPFAPDIPTLGELGHPTLDFDLWFGFLGPANLAARDRAVVGEGACRDRRDAGRARSLAPRKASLRCISMRPPTGARIKSEVARWTAVAQKAGLKPE